MHTEVEVVVVTPNTLLADVVYPVVVPGLARAGTECI